MVGADVERSRALLLGFVAALTLTYLFGVGPPYPGIDGFTPYGPIAIALLATIGSAMLVHRLTRNTTLGVSTGLLIMALALIALAQIATVAYIPAGLLVVLALGGFVAGVAWSDDIPYLAAQQQKRQRK